MNMAKDNGKKQRVWILTKAFPQPSQHHEETVCCAGITEDGREMQRLYPIHYRLLKPSQQFERYELVTLETLQPTDDPRPESAQVVDDSIALVTGHTLPPRERFKLWLPFVADSLEALQQENIETGRSLGIVYPDPASVRFSWKSTTEASDEECENLWVGRQVMLLDKELPPLQKDFTFFYTFTTGQKRHRRQILDWAVQATYYHYSKQYGDEALPRMRTMWQESFVKQNLHLVMGTMLTHPRAFNIIGVLRTVADIDAFKAQGDLFG